MARRGTDGARAASTAIVDPDAMESARMTRAGLRLPRVCIWATDEVGVCPWIVRDPLNPPADASVLNHRRLMNSSQDHAQVRFL